MSESTNALPSSDDAGKKAVKSLEERKAEAKKAFMGYFQRLTQGCGRPNCWNKDCASSSGFKPVPKAEAFKRALALTKKHSKICELVKKTENIVAQKRKADSEPKKADQTPNGSKREKVPKPETAIEPLTLSRFEEALGPDENRKDAELKEATRMVREVFGNDIALSSSFASSKELKATRENPGMDFKSLDEFYVRVEKFSPVQEALNQAIHRMCASIRLFSEKTDTPLYKLRKYLIVLENPSFLDPEYHPEFQKLCEGISKLPSSLQDILVKWFSKYTSRRMEELIGRTQQYITVKWYTGRQIDDLHHGAFLLGLLYRANEPWRPHANHEYKEQKGRRGGLHRLLMRNREKKEGSSSRSEDVKESNPPKVVISNNSNQEGRHQPLVDPSMFNNDAVNTDLNVKADYKRWIENKTFSFCKYNWILDASSKRDILQLDARYQMGIHFRDAYLQRLYTGLMSAPYLILKVRRNNLIRDSIVQLQNARLENMQDDDDEENNMYFKKPLKIKFEGEEGVDEGGVQKEFFQLVTGQLFDPKYGMFTYDEASRACWFNRNSVSSDEEYELIGIILGLAIYNGVILDLRFPMYVYKKLMGFDTTMADMQEVDPEMAKGFEKLLKFPGDVENTFCRNFSVSYEVFGAEKTVELKKGGAKIPLNKENREEYVNLYVKWLLHDSISRQFNAFKKGFMKVCGGPALRLFRPEELHLMICGTDTLDFDALEQNAQYDGGFNADSAVIKNLWRILKSFSFEQKKKFLMFCTGSDRAPINGLKDLTFTISRNGPDSDSLPTSHTCFNHLLLPEYASPEKLERSLNIAIENCKGFGLL